MPKNKNKPNAFLAFMIEWKKNQERKGRTFPNGLKDIQMDPDCNKEWQELSEHDKAYYKELCKKETTQKTKKRTGIGELVEDIKIAEQKEKEFHDNMIEYISDLIKMAKVKNAVPDIKFFLIHVNYFYFRVIDNNQLEYYPAEIAIGEFTLRDGLSRIYNVIINEKIIMGHTQSAKEQSEKTHQIPIEPEFGKEDYCQIFREICEFLEPAKKNGTYPPLYTVSKMEDIHTCAKSVLARLSAANNESDQFFKLYSFEDFFTILYNSIDAMVISCPLEPVTALIEIKKDPYGYKPDLCCTYHESVQVGTLHCSHSIIQRWFFILCNFCCEPLGIDMIQGVHLPKEHIYLTESLAALSICNRSRRSSSLMSLSESSYDHKKHSSERTYAEEQRRRAEASSRPLYIVQKSQVKPPPVKKPQEPVVQRPLRLPLTKSVGLTFDSTDTESMTDSLFSECSFPSIGRGAIKKKTEPKRNGAGHGYADAVKS
ncbi:protein maelstrom homolog [Copidosoma floridanum]|uniref:protein maelstrom homolog n=1 Tax=Copidosoma floridanum TaxID=29053 RepID=UPI0006C9571E|nr:protein maelstrom homolog [Copidosoma floridanum]